MDGKSLNIMKEKLDKLKGIIPEAFTEKKIDWEKLKISLRENIEFKNERHVLNWAGKSNFFRVLQSPTTATLVPAKDESVNFDKTENIFIKGENLEVLKVLQKSCFGKIKMIYIYPPFNTGNDNFIYPDKFSETKEEYLNRIGGKDESGYITREGLFRKNSKGSGHYNNNWFSMMYPRLFPARSSYRKNYSQYFSVSHDYILIYSKLREKWNRILLPRDNTDAYSNPDKDPKGPWKPYPMTAHNYYSADYKIKKPNGVILSRPKDRYWAFSEETWNEKVKKNEIIWGEVNSYPMIKRYLSEVQRGLVPVILFDRKFTGSATTAHAVLNLNKEADGNRKFILVQLPEKCNENSETCKAGYKTIAEIGKERIRRVIEKIKEEQDGKLDSDGNKDKQDFGFKVFKLRDSNFKIWRTKFENEEQLVEQSQLQQYLEPLDENAKTEDVLYELLFKSGVPLTTEIEEIDLSAGGAAQASGYYLVNDNEIALILEKVDKKIIKSVIETKPKKVITIDRLFDNNDQLKINTALQMKDTEIEFKVV